MFKITYFSIHKTIFFDMWKFSHTFGRESRFESRNEFWIDTYLHYTQDLFLRSSTCTYELLYIFLSKFGIFAMLVSNRLFYIWYMIVFFCTLVIWGISTPLCTLVIWGMYTILYTRNLRDVHYVIWGIFFVVNPCNLRT